MYDELHLRLCVHMYLDWLLLTQPQTTVVVQSGKMHATRSAARVRAVRFDNAHARKHTHIYVCTHARTQAFDLCRRAFDIPNYPESLSIIDG